MTKYAVLRHRLFSALRESNGNTAEASRISGVSQSAILQYCKTYPDLRDHAAKIRERHAVSVRKEIVNAVKKFGKLSLACEYTGAGYSRAVHWVMEEPEFKAAVEHARMIYKDEVEDEIRERAIDGWEEPVVHKGEQAWQYVLKANGQVIPNDEVTEKDENGKYIYARNDLERVPLTILHKSESCLLALAKAVMPERYRDSGQSTVGQPERDELLTVDPALVSAQLPPGSVPGQPAPGAGAVVGEPGTVQGDSGGASGVQD